MKTKNLVRKSLKILKLFSGFEGKDKNSEK